MDKATTKTATTYRNHRHITILGQPVAKGRPRACMRGAHAHIYTPKETAYYESMVRCTWRDKYETAPKLNGALSVSIVAYFQIQKSGYNSKGELNKQGRAKELGIIRPTGRPDADNLAKSILDALNSGVAFDDDSQICELKIEKAYAREPKVELYIWEMETTAVENAVDNTFEVMD